MSKPFPLAKLYHKAGKMRSDGAVSALCFARPRAIDLTRALWTIRPEAVTCRALAWFLNTFQINHVDRAVAGSLARFRRGVELETQALGEDA